MRNKCLFLIALGMQSVVTLTFWCIAVLYSFRDDWGIACSSGASFGPYCASSPVQAYLVAFMAMIINIITFKKIKNMANK